MEFRPLGKPRALCLFYVLLCLERTHARAVRNFVFPDRQQATFAAELSDYDISIPVKVDHQGAFLSNRLHHKLSHSHKRKRSTDFSSNEHPIHYKLSIEGKELTIKMRPNHLMLSPGLVVERRQQKFGNVSDAKISHWNKDLCHFIGHIQDHPNSFVAMGTCNGLTGLLRTNETEYFIEPVKGHDIARDPNQPHMIYKRSAVVQSQSYNKGHHESQSNRDAGCGVRSEKRNIDDVERERWERDVRQKERKNTHRRRKRSVSTERNVEVLVVADTKMVEYYKKEDIETYILTIMNMVSALYHDASIGNAINIVLVRLILLEMEEPELRISHHADHTLASFCKWQKSINPRDENHQNHHDVAVLLTRKNICARMNEPCSTLGLAQVSGMCQPHRSCNINEDTGLSLAYTVAHELGHNLGMKHDDYLSECSNSYNQPVKFIMAPMLDADSSALVWSNCSRKAVTQFLDRDWGFCLDDEPSDGESQFEFPVLPPGAMYDADHQCRLQYGHKATYCNGIENVCSTLWCKVNNKCMTRLEPAAEGTMCGEGKWCYAHECRTIGEHPQTPAIDGEWGQWGEWTQCSRTCGAGVSQSQRHCDNPPPSNGGRYCLGERRRYRVCETKACREDAPSFRQIQCEEFNYVPYKNGLYKWQAIPQPASPCQLHCKPINRFFSVMLRDSAADGTPCRPGSRDMCINGLCRHIGCDWGIDSKAREDRCGICHGDGSTCTMIKQQFSKQRGLGYVEATVIPKGARNIRVEEVAEANNYLAVRNDHGKYYLNGDWYIQWSGDYEAAGTVIHYNREGNKERFMAPGPLKESLHIMLLFQSQNPGVIFEYTVPKENATIVRIQEFRWRYLDWTHCTVSCGGGMKRSQVVCKEREAGIVEDLYCNKTSKPDDKVKSCNEHLCPARWWSGPWQHCSVTCGDDGRHKRTVICVRSKGPAEQIALDVKECDSIPKPREVEPCHRKAPCPGQAEWNVGQWTQTCRHDPCQNQTRSVVCSDLQIGCHLKVKPVSVQKCGNATCGHWMVTEWSMCTRSCGSGLQFRNVHCSGGEFCVKDKMPVSEQVCNKQLCLLHHLYPMLLSDQPTNENHGKSIDSNDMDNKIPQGKGRLSDVKVEHESEEMLIYPKSQSEGQNGMNETNNEINSEPDKQKVQSTDEEDIVTEEDISEFSHADIETEKYSDDLDEIKQKNDTESPNVKPSNPSPSNGSTSAQESNISGDPIGLQEIIITSAQTQSYSETDTEDLGRTSTESSITTTNTLNGIKNNSISSNSTNLQSPPQPLLRKSLDSKSKIAENEVMLDKATKNEINANLKTGKTLGMTSKSEELVHHEPTSRNQNGSSTMKMTVSESTMQPTITKSKVTRKPVLYKWIHLFWQECSAHCGGGVRRRQLMCIEIKTYEEVDMSACSPERKPADMEPCNTQPCMTWNITEWSQCSVTCGGGSQQRHVTCPQPHQCNHDDKPVQHQRCNTDACLDWVAGPWSQCTKPCGGGNQVRHVQCIDTQIQQPASGCDDHKQPAPTQTCNSQKCPEQKAAALSIGSRSCQTNKMSYPVCKMLKRRGQCIHRYIKVQCCKTCSEKPQWSYSPRQQLT